MSLTLEVDATSVKMRLRQGLLETDSTYHFMVPLLDYQAFAIFGDTASNCLSPT